MQHAGGETVDDRPADEAMPHTRRGARTDGEAVRPLVHLRDSREADGGDPTRTRILPAVDDDADRHGDHPLDRRIDRPADGDEADPDDLHHHSSKVTP